MKYQAHYPGDHGFDTTRYDRAIVDGHRLRSEAFRNLLIGPVARAVRALAEAMAESARRTQTIRELESLSDRMLEDIGVNRSEIPYLAARLAARKAVTSGRTDLFRSDSSARTAHVVAGAAANDDHGDLLARAGRA